MAQKIIIDTDPGVDDAMAIHLAFADPRLEVVGLTSVFGNVWVEQATRNALYLAEMAHYDCDVAAGASKPLHIVPNDPSHFVHGDEGFGDLPAQSPKKPADTRQAHIYLSETIRAHSGEIILCPVGPLTNIAKLLEYDPEIVAHVQKVVIMGGSGYAPGNVTAFAEANIWNDPHAADIVFAANWTVEMIGLDVTTKVECSPEDFVDLAKAAPDIGGFIKESANFYIRFYESVIGRKVCLMHDPSAIIAITDPDFFTYDSVPVSVIVEGEEIGRTMPMPKSDYPDLNRPDVRIATGVNAKAVREAYLSLSAQMDSAAKARKSNQA